MADIAHPQIVQGREYGTISQARWWRGHLQGSEYAWALAFCIPYVAVFFAFVVYPVAFGIWMGSDAALYPRLSMTRSTGRPWSTRLCSSASRST